MSRVNEQLLEKVIALYNNAIYNQIVYGGYSSSTAIMYGAKKNAYSDVIQEMTGLSKKEVSEKYCKWNKDELWIKRQEYTKEHQIKDFERERMALEAPKGMYK